MAMLGILGCIGIFLKAESKGEILHSTLFRSE